MLRIHDALDFARWRWNIYAITLLLIPIGSMLVSMLMHWLKYDNRPILDWYAMLFLLNVFAGIRVGYEHVCGNRKQALMFGSAIIAALVLFWVYLCIMVEVWPVIGLSLEQQAVEIGKSVEATLMLFGYTLVLLLVWCGSLLYYKIWWRPSAPEPPAVAT